MVYQQTGIHQNPVIILMYNIFVYGTPDNVWVQQVHALNLSE